MRHIEQSGFLHLDTYLYFVTHRKVKQITNNRLAWSAK